MNLDYEERHNVLVDLAMDMPIDSDISDGDIIRMLAQEILSLKKQIEKMSQYINWPL